MKAPRYQGFWLWRKEFEGLEQGPRMDEAYQGRNLEGLASSHLDLEEALQEAKKEGAVYDNKVTVRHPSSR